MNYLHHLPGVLHLKELVNIQLKSRVTMIFCTHLQGVFHAFFLITALVAHTLTGKTPPGKRLLSHLSPNEMRLKFA